MPAETPDANFQTEYWIIGSTGNYYYLEIIITKVGRHQKGITNKTTREKGINKDLHPVLCKKCDYQNEKSLRSV